MLDVLKNPGESLGWSKHLELGLTASGLEGGEGRRCTCTVWSVLGKIKQRVLLILHLKTSTST